MHSLSIDYRLYRILTSFLLFLFRFCLNFFLNFRFGFRSSLLVGAGDFLRKKEMLKIEESFPIIG